MKDNYKWVEKIEDPKHKEAMEKIIEYKKLKDFYEEGVWVECKDHSGEKVELPFMRRHEAIEHFIGDGQLTGYDVFNECEDEMDSWLMMAQRNK